MWGMFYYKLSVQFDVISTKLCLTLQFNIWIKINKMIKNKWLLWQSDNL